MTLFPTALTGRLDAKGAETALAEIERAIGDLHPTHILLDLEKVTYVSSAGLRVLLILHRRCTSAKGSLVLIAPSAICRELLEVAGLLGEFPTFRSEADARKSLEG